MTYRFGIFSPSSWVDEAKIQVASDVLKDTGHDVVIHPQTFLRYNQSAGTEQEKKAAFLELMADEHIDVIWAAGGGNRCLHFLDKLSKTELKELPPKKLIGFSDVTALLNSLGAYGSVTPIHGPVFSQISSKEQLETVLPALSGQQIKITGCEIIKPGTATGLAIGGNLSVFHFWLVKYAADIFWENKILFLEDCNEELSHIDRLLWSLQTMGVFDKVRGIVIGDFSNLKDTGKPFDFDLNNLIRDYTANCSGPVLLSTLFGHSDTNLPFILNHPVTITV